jgi:hypothetical protein
MTIWTFAIDESGRPEGGELDGEVDDRLPFIIGGPLVPHAAEAAHDSIGQAIEQAGRGIGLTMPPHAADLSPDHRARLRETAASTVADAKGYWLFVVDQPTSPRDPIARLLRYARVLTSAVDAATRFVGLLDGTEIELCIAQRTIPLTRSQVDELARSGVSHREEPTKYGTGFRVVVESEARQAVEAVAREPVGYMKPSPALRSVDVGSATDPRARRALWAADLGTNAARAHFHQHAPNAPSELLRGGNVILADQTALRAVRDLERALRREPPRLHEAADARARAMRSSTAALGLDGVLEHAWARALDTAARRMRQRGARDIIRAATAMVSTAEQILGERAGAYEGLWRALEATWIGDSELAHVIREYATDPGLRMRYARVTAECANHRGDVARTRRAANDFEVAAGSRRSLRVLADRLLLRNLVVVHAQNKLPCEDTEERAEVEDEIRVATVDLAAAESDARAVLELGSSAPVTPRDPAPDEVELAALLGVSVRPEYPDPDRGAALGTIARSYGFLGEIDTALEWALRARALFRDSEPDLRFNGAVLCRLLLEDARLRGAASDGRASARRIALQMAGVDLKTAKWARPEGIRRDKGVRFAIDLALRALLWAPEAAPSSKPWITVLAAHGEGSVHAALVAERSHPTELIARHAFELCQRERVTDAATRWLELAALCAKGAPPETTIARLGRVTQTIAAGDPRGWRASFEYR